MKDHGKPIDEGRIYASQWAVVADDPEKLWAEGLGEKALFQLNEYIAWGAFDSPGAPRPPFFPDQQSLLDSGFYRLMDAAAVVDDLVGLGRSYPQIRDSTTGRSCPGRRSSRARRVSSTSRTRSFPRLPGSFRPSPSRHSPPVPPS